MKSQQGYFSSDGNYQSCLFISFGKQKIKENILVECFLSNITEGFFFSIILSLFPFHMFIHILIKYVLCDIHCHNYSNSNQHLYILYYATQQDRCSMPVCTHKKSLWKCSHFTAEKHTAQRGFRSDFLKAKLCNQYLNLGYWFHSPKFMTSFLINNLSLKKDRDYYSVIKNRTFVDNS